jgi:DNA-binding MarR family transcriptional regulator
MRRVSNYVSSSFARRLADLDVTVAEWVVLRQMYGHEETTSPGAVAELVGLTRSAVSKLVDRLLEKGLVMRRPSRSDRRYQEIELTPAAIKLVPRLSDAADENDEAIFGVLSPSERGTLLRILKKAAAFHNLTRTPIE